MEIKPSNFTAIGYVTLLLKKMVYYKFLLENIGLFTDYMLITNFPED